MTATSINRLLLGLVLVAGGTAVWLFVFSLGSAIWQNFNHQRQFPDQYQVYVTPAGEALVRQIHWKDVGGRFTASYETLDLDGTAISHPLNSNSERDVSDRQGLVVSVPGRPTRDYWAGVAVKELPQPLPWRLRPETFLEPSGIPYPQNRWHFIRPPRPAGSGYFECFDSRSKARAGYLGINGFSEVEPDPAHQFPAWSADGLHLIRFLTSNYAHDFHFGSLVGNRAAIANSMLALNAPNEPTAFGVLAVSPQRDAVFVVNFTAKSVRRFELSGLLAYSHFQTPSEVDNLPESVDSYTSASRQAAKPQQRILLRFRDRVEIRTPNFELVELIPLPPEVLGVLDEHFTLHKVRDGYLAVLNGAIAVENQSKWNVRLLWFDHQGQVTREAMTSWPMHNATTTIDVSLAASLQPLGILSSYLSAFHSASGPINPQTRKLIVQPDEPVTWAVRMAVVNYVWRQHHTSIMASLLAGSIVSVACWLRQRRFKMSRFDTVVWPLFVFCFGPIGWVAYISPRRWSRCCSPQP